MKTFTSLRLFIATVVYLSCQVGIAQVKTAVNSGDWNDPSNWSPVGVPAFDSTVDSVIIQADITFSGLLLLHDINYLKIEEGFSLQGLAVADSLINESDTTINNGTLSAGFMVHSNVVKNNAVVSGSKQIYNDNAVNNGQISGDSLVFLSLVNEANIESDLFIVFGDYCLNNAVISCQGNIVSGARVENNEIIYCGESLTTGFELINYAEGFIEIGDTLDNRGYVENASQITTKNLFNLNEITGSNGRFCVDALFQNFNSISGTIDICDATPGDALDFNFGSIAPSVTNCLAGNCSSLSIDQPGTDRDLKYSLYPNPASTFVKIDFPDLSEKATFLLYDLVGHVVYSNTIEGGNLQLDVSELSGAYIYKISTPSHATSGKLIVN